MGKEQSQANSLGDFVVVVLSFLFSQQGYWLFAFLSESQQTHIGGFSFLFESEPLHA